jgi:membrane protease YdiL (CAAX protease family)
MEKISVKPIFSILKILFFIGGLLVFAGFLHQTVPLLIISLTGLFISASVIAIEIRTFKDLFSLFNWYQFTKKNIFYLPVSIAIGSVFGILYRNYLNVDILPVKLTGFAVIAAAVGSSEEILFRGYLQSQIRKFNVILSVLVATFAHTAYKLLLFLPYRSAPDIEISFISQWTLLGGLVFALLKEFSQNSIYPVLSHALFDLLVYGDNIAAPWWVWA